MALTMELHAMNEHCNGVKNRGLPTWPIPMAQFSRPNWPSKGTLLFQRVPSIFMAVDLTIYATECALSDQLC